ncbi:hypothetical protein UFOVP19_22 [uncultured Caudovirales phage]|uniref:Uncharacterized protein n=1 Tax=uncultured Caudovirales phage TaxID=2100421 RepID=A0A6J5KKT4_9CAUD|nr:hypothetical protein UFOVP19_22 [uncultured Caudovirales phage]
MKKIKVIYKKLGRHNVYGFANCGYNEIEIDSRLKGKKALELLIHESMHILFPEAEEEEIESKSIILTNTIWSEQYRRVDNSKSLPLQDGSK